MTITNPFTLATLTTVETQPACPVEHTDTPYETLCADAQRPAAFTMTFVEPVAA